MLPIAAASSTLSRESIRDGHNSSPYWTGSVGRLMLLSSDGPTQAAELHPASSITRSTRCNLIYILCACCISRAVAGRTGGGNIPTGSFFAFWAGVRPTTSHPPFIAVRPQQAVSCGVQIIDSAMTREPAFTASGILPFCLARRFLWFRLQQMSISGTQIDAHSRRSGNATTGMIRFASVPCPHWRCALWLRARLHDCCISARSDQVTAPLLVDKRAILGSTAAQSEMSLISMTPCYAMVYVLPQSGRLDVPNTSCMHACPGLNPMISRMVFMRVSESLPHLVSNITACCLRDSTPNNIQVLGYVH